MTQKPCTSTPHIIPPPTQFPQPCKLPTILPPPLLPCCPNRNTPPACPTVPRFPRCPPCSKPCYNLLCGKNTCCATSKRNGDVSENVSSFNNCNFFCSELPQGLEGPDICETLSKRQQEICETLPKRQQEICETNSERNSTSTRSDEDCNEETSYEAEYKSDIIEKGGRTQHGRSYSNRTIRFSPTKSDETNFTYATEKDDEVEVDSIYSLCPRISGRSKGKSGGLFSLSDLLTGSSSDHQKKPACQTKQDTSSFTNAHGDGENDNNGISGEELSGIRNYRTNSNSSTFKGTSTTNYSSNNYILKSGESKAKRKQRHWSNVEKGDCNKSEKKCSNFRNVQTPTSGLNDTSSVISRTENHGNQSSHRSNNGSFFNKYKDGLRDDISLSGQDSNRSTLLGMEDKSKKHDAELPFKQSFCVMTVLFEKAERDRTRHRTPIVQSGGSGNGNTRSTNEAKNRIYDYESTPSTHTGINQIGTPQQLSNRNPGPALEYYPAPPSPFNTPQVNANVPNALQHVTPDQHPLGLSYPSAQVSSFNPTFIPQNNMPHVNSVIQKSNVGACPIACSFPCFPCVPCPVYFSGRMNTTTYCSQEPPVQSIDEDPEHKNSYLSPTSSSPPQVPPRRPPRGPRDPTLPSKSDSPTKSRPYNLPPNFKYNPPKGRPLVRPPCCPCDDLDKRFTPPPGYRMKLRAKRNCVPCACTDSSASSYQGGIKKKSECCDTCECGCEFCECCCRRCDHR